VLKTGIKERIEKINKLKSGFITEGYKNTDFGILPVDWDVKKVSTLVKEEILNRPIDGNHGAIHPTTKDYVESGIPFILASDVGNHKINLKSCKFIKKEHADKLQKGFAMSGDVLLTHKGSVGNTAVVPNLQTDYIMLTPQVTYYRIKDASRLNNYYLKSYFQSEIFQGYLKVMSKGATRDYIGIVEQQKLNIIVPRSVKEQQKIAEILSTWDKAIELKKQLIEDKKKQKKGLMEKLLTGEVRLQGFEGEWKEVRINKIAKVSIGLVTTMTTNYVDEGILLIRNSDILENDFKTKGLIYLDRQFAEKNKNRQFEIDDIVTVHTGDVGMSAVINKKFEGSLGFATLNTRVIDKKRWNSKFISHYFNSEKYKNFALKMSTGDGRNNLNLKDFKNSMIPDISIEEQNEISKILDCFNREVLLTEQELEALKLQLKGLMQLILTGIVRVKY